MTSVMGTPISVYMSLSTLTLLYLPLIWNSHARIPHNSGHPRAANGFPFVARSSCSSCCCEMETDYGVMSSLYSREDE